MTKNKEETPLDRSVIVTGLVDKYSEKVIDFLSKEIPSSAGIISEFEKMIEADSLKFIEFLLSTISEGVAIFSILKEDAYFILLNPAGKIMMGIEGPVSHRSLTEIFPEVNEHLKNTHSFLEILLKVNESGEKQVLYLSYPYPDGESVYRYTLSSPGIKSSRIVGYVLLLIERV